MSEVIPQVDEQSGVISYRHRAMLHRKGGPAVIYPDGYETWWLLGNKVLSWLDYKFMSGCSDEELMFLKLKYGEDAHD